MSRIEDKRKRLQELQAQIDAMEAREAEKQRKNDTRRKIIAGALALEHMDNNPKSEFGKKLAALLDEYVTKPGERALFGLKPIPKSESSASSTIKGEFANNA